MDQGQLTPAKASSPKGQRKKKTGPSGRARGGGGPELGPSPAGPEQGPSSLPEALAGGMGLRAEVTIQNRLGLHARAATKLSQVLEEYDAEVWLLRGGALADAKSILDLLGLCCPRNTPVEVMSAGKDAREALTAAVALIEDNFGEDE